jgi:hypothetical protein
MIDSKKSQVKIGTETQSQVKIGTETDQSSIYFLVNSRTDLVFSQTMGLICFKSNISHLSRYLTCAEEKNRAQNRTNRSGFRPAIRAVARSVPSAVREKLGFLPGASVRLFP